MDNKAMTPNGQRICQTCNGLKTLPKTIKGQIVQCPCPSCKGTGIGQYATK